MIRYGILSTASIVDRFVAGIRESGDGYVQAIASRSLEKAKIAAERLNIDNYYGSYDELFEDDNIKVLRCLLKEKIAEAEDVLVLTDMLSASTTQIAATLLPRGKIEIVSGVNLAMLIYAIRERNFYDVTDLAEKAKQAALEDIVNVRKRMNEE